jgi:hypothetical protein
MTAKVWMRSLLQTTVWSRYNKMNVPDRYELIYTFVLPFKYAAIAIYGLVSIAYPVTSIDLLLGGIYGDLWSFALLIGGTTAFVGICFYPKLLMMEAVAAVTLVTLMIIYVGCIFGAALFGGEPFKYLSLILVLILLPMPSWRVWDIVRELRPPVVA